MHCSRWSEKTAAEIIETEGNYDKQTLDFNLFIDSVAMRSKTIVFLFVFFLQSNDNYVITNHAMFLFIH